MPPARVRHRSHQVQTLANMGVHFVTFLRNDLRPFGEVCCVIRRESSSQWCRLGEWWGGVGGRGGERARVRARVGGVCVCVCECVGEFASLVHTILAAPSTHGDPSLLLYLVVVHDARLLSDPRGCRGNDGECEKVNFLGLKLASDPRNNVTVEFWPGFHLCAFLM